MEHNFVYDDNFIYAHRTSDEHPCNTDFSLHTHERCEIFCFLGGKGQFKIEGSTYPLSSGDILIMRSGEAHYIDIDPSFSYTRISIHFDAGIFDGFDKERTLLIPFTMRERGKLNHYSADELGSSYRKLIDGLSYDKNPDRLSIIAMLLPLINDIRTAFNRKPSPTEDETVIQRVIRYLNSNLAEHISLDDICREFYISKPQLCRLFKATTGSTVWEYITAKRLILAQSYIRAGHAPTKIFAECGFGDYSSFFRAYKKKFGTSPKQ